MCVGVVDLRGVTLVGSGGPGCRNRAGISSGASGGV